jgi:DNA-binding FadR family transcriptional regulator
MEKISLNIEFHHLLARPSKNHLFVIILGSITAAAKEAKDLSPE